MRTAMLGLPPAQMAAMAQGGAALIALNLNEGSWRAYEVIF